MIVPQLAVRSDRPFVIFLCSVQAEGAPKTHFETILGEDARYTRRSPPPRFLDGVKFEYCCCQRLLANLVKRTSADGLPDATKVTNKCAICGTARQARVSGSLLKEERTLLVTLPRSVCLRRENVVPERERHVR